MKHVDQSLLDAPIMVVGLIRNGVATLEANIAVLSKALSKFSEVHWLLVESDSTDGTEQLLRDISERVPRFRYLSQGNLNEKMPQRTERLAFCRNVYRQEILNNPLYQQVKYVIVSDLDDTNSLLSEEAILSCWERDDWDVVTANQKGPYYDIWALRHPVWCSNDCWLEHRFLSQFNNRHLDLTYACVYSKMIEVPNHLDWLEVDSAFGGLAIYKKSTMKMGVYVGLYANGSEVCEHVPFNMGIRETGGRIFLNPRLINTDYTDHSLPLKTA
ncbi:hypothetical protein [Polynucleobacter sp. JS-Polo-80-F4]|uniref:hypothetical protein n=1 Tax=Polynucleobacter sp. JS-Polo-80-F4 TaxID=2576918 RepID=UPI001C0DA18F|nr:hypothetical protein [Polynucleobacter sp. JS-Polo-80-F4]MBU3616543.1 hypothetical protein [Polynucleobacter sp. JS-Polo-80-F4]